MNFFFNELYVKIIIKCIDKKIYEVIDWLLYDDKFNAKKWDKNKLAKFIKIIKKKYFSKKNYQYSSIRELIIPKRKDTLFIAISNGNAESKDLIRHIRNGIAHGQSKIRNIKSIIYIELKDYNKQGLQTAYMMLTVDFLIDIYHTYKSLL